MPRKLSKDQIFRLVTNITMNQVPKTKEWASEIACKYKVAIKITDLGRVLVKGESKEICTEAMGALKKRVISDDFQNALEVANLLETTPYNEQFTVSKEQLARLDKLETKELLKSYETILRCVIKIDRTGHISIFGDKQSCKAFRAVITNMVTKEEAKTAVQEEAASAADTTIVIKKKKSTSVAGATKGKPEDKSGSTSNKNSESPGTVKSSNGGSPGTIKLSKGDCNPTSLPRPPVNATQSFAQAGNTDKSGVVYKFRDKLVIDEKNTGRVIGRGGSNRERVEAKFKCRIEIDKNRECGMVAVLIQGHTEQDVKGAKKDILDMLEKPGPWQTFNPSYQKATGGNSDTVKSQSGASGTDVIKWPTKQVDKGNDGGPKPSG